MIRKDKTVKANGKVKTQIRVVEGYREPGTGKAKQRTVKNFGYLEDQEDQQAFLLEVQKFDETFKKEKTVSINRIKSTIPFYESIESRIYNFGYRYLESIFDSLELEDIFMEYDYKGTHSLLDIFKYLVIKQIMNPDSIRASYQQKDNFISLNKSEFQLYDVYRTLSHFSVLGNSIQKRINEVIKNSIGRNTKYAYYDTTNYFFEKDYNDPDEYIEINYIPRTKTEMKEQKIIEIEIDGIKKYFKIKDGFRHNGVSKENRTSPIVQLGLFMDDNGLPMNFEMFSGNTTDSKTLLPTLKKIKKDYNLERIIVVADKGINTSENIDYICNNGDGYMFSQVLRGKKGKRYYNQLFDNNGYTVVNEDYKYKLFEETYKSYDKNGKEIERKRKVLLYYNGEEARRTKRKRQEKLLKAQNSIDNNTYKLDHSSNKYIKTIGSVKQTGEIADEIIVYIDEEKAKYEEQFDGYFCIITSELDFTMEDIRKAYHGLWQIEDTFRITKTELNARPVYVRLEEHIKGHFQICFVALTIIRLLQYKMDYKISTERIIRALNMCSCSEIDNGVMHLMTSSTNNEYLYKTSSKDMSKYSTLNTSSIVKETIEDYKLILKQYEADILNTFHTKNDFDKKLNSIKFKLK